MMVHWKEGPLFPSLVPGEVHIWFADLYQLNNRIKYEWLSSDERVRAAKYHFVQDRMRFITARGILRMLLSRYLMLKPKDVHFSYGLFGKPYLVHATLNLPLTFNLSHSNTSVLLAISLYQEIGIDIQSIRNHPAILLALRSCLAESERVALLQIPINEQVTYLYRYWVCKEAFMKTTGWGFQIPPYKIIVDLENISQPKLWFGNPRITKSKYWYLSLLNIDMSHAALCVEGPIDACCFWTLK